MFENFYENNKRNGKNMEYKQYYRRSLEEILNQYITLEKYRDFVPVLQEIFQRRSYEFAFSDEHMEKEVQNFIDKVKTIKFVSNEEVENKKVVAAYRPELKEIVINRDNLGRKENASDTHIYLKLFKVLTHETYHAINQREDGCTGLNYRTKVDENKEIEHGIALNEAFTERAAFRTCINEKDAKNYSTEASSYPTITFVTNLLAASLGVSEKEILKAGSQNRNELEKLFRRKFQDKVALVKSAQLFQSFEGCLDVLYNSAYKKIKGSEDLDINKVCLKEMYSNIYEMTFLQISNDKRDFSSNNTGELIYRFAKIKKIINESVDKLIAFKQIKPEDKNEILGDILQNKKAYILKEDYDNGKLWNNQAIEQLMKKICEREKQTNFNSDLVTKVEEERVEKRGRLFQMVEILKNIVTRIKNTRKKTLPPPPNDFLKKSDETQGCDNLPQNLWQVSKENLIPMRNIIKQTKHKPTNQRGDEKYEKY